MACCPVAIPRAENLFQDVFGQIQTGQFSPSVYIYIYHGWYYNDFLSVQSTILVIYNVSLYRIVYVVYYIFTLDSSICLFMYIYIFI